MPTVDFGPCECCGESGSSTGSSSGPCPCPDDETLHLDFEGEVIPLSGGPGIWTGTGTPGSCVADWTFQVQCQANNIWRLTVTKGADATQCSVSGSQLAGEIISCDPPEVEFHVPVTESSPSCCLGGSFPRNIPVLVTL